MRRQMNLKRLQKNALIARDRIAGEIGEQGRDFSVPLDLKPRKSFGRTGLRGNDRRAGERGQQGDRLAGRQQASRLTDEAAGTGEGGRRPDGDVRGRDGGGVPGGGEAPALARVVAATQTRSPRGFGMVREP